MKMFFILLTGIIALLFIACQNDDEGIQSLGSADNFQARRDVNFIIFDSTANQNIFDDEFEIFRPFHSEQYILQGNGDSESKYNLTYSVNPGKVGTTYTIPHSFQYSNEDLDYLEITHL